MGLNTEERQAVVYFTGYEVEKTPAFEEHTLFVVGPRPLQEVLEQAKKNTVDHIYLGANQSFNIDGGTSGQWDELVKGLLKENYMVTLDYDVKFHSWVLESGYNEHKKFISMISVKLPYIDQLNYNACVKIDDKDFDATNPGVWVHRMHDLKEKAVFTDWSKYTRDTIIT